ncbi:MAG: hypothetical protein M3228_08405 [Actinomycetota bacterium]|nr:hypothetical protein [Actinomycetota bacterium]MDQ4010701.1 hypothetical protein [Actinomycetota bacterium]
MTVDDGAGLRAEDLMRHLADLVAHSYEGAESWPDRLAVFHQAVTLLDPVVRGVLAEADATFLENTGGIARHSVEHGDGSVGEHWELSWPRQREAISRDGGPVAPVEVIAWFRRSFNHAHLRGSTAGDWPLQVTSTDDATRQLPIVRAIVEAELHQRIYEGRYPVMPVAVRKYGLPPS